MDLKTRAFTLIELLIVVAIIAILAAIAVPNFLEAQVRAKISRAKADLRTVTTGLESYQIDNNSYPKSNIVSWALSYGSPHPQMLPTLERLTTPVSYLASGASYTDPFVGKNQRFGPNLGQEEPIRDSGSQYGVPADSNGDRLYRFISRGPTDTTIWGQPRDMQKAIWYMLESCGPDGYYHRMGNALNFVDGPARRRILSSTIYDATNGTVSRGSIWRAGGGTGRGSYFKEMAQ